MKNSISKLENNTHFWAYDERGYMSVFIIDENRRIYIAGGWEGTYDENEITFIEEIKKPKTK